MNFDAPEVPLDGSKMAAVVLGLISAGSVTLELPNNVSYSMEFSKVPSTMSFERNPPLEASDALQLCKNTGSIFMTIFVISIRTIFISKRFPKSD